MSLCSFYWSSSLSLEAIWSGAQRAELEAANSDKGGHRAKAIGLVDEAIGEVQAGIEFARTH